MPLYCDELPTQTLAGLNRRLARADPAHPLYQQAYKGNVVAKREGDFVVYQSENDFYIQRVLHDTETTIVMDISHPRNCLTIPMTSNNDADIHRFIEENSLPRWREYIETSPIYRDNTHITLVKIPAVMVRSLMCRGGGALRTIYTGEAEVLSTIPLLKKLKVINEKQTGRIGSVLETAYGRDKLEEARTFHWRLVQQVILRPHSGICLKFVASWTPNGPNP
jgi:hypothetical protein